MQMQARDSIHSGTAHSQEHSKRRTMEVPCGQALSLMHRAQARSFHVLRARRAAAPFDLRWTSDGLRKGTARPKTTTAAFSSGPILILLQFDNGKCSGLRPSWQPDCSKTTLTSTGYPLHFCERTLGTLMIISPDFRDCQRC